MDNLIFVSNLFVKVLALICPLIWIEGLIEEGIKTYKEKALLVLLIIIFAIFLFLLK